MTSDSSAVFDLAGLVDLLRLGGPVVAVLVAMSVIALAIVRALQALGCEVADLEVTLRREESAPEV